MFAFFTHTHSTKQTTVSMKQTDVSNYVKKCKWKHAVYPFKQTKSFYIKVSMVSNYVKCIKREN